MGYNPWGHKELDMSEVISMHFVKDINDCFVFFFSSRNLTDVDRVQAIVD